MTDLIGRTLGQYRVIEQIGEGGMATVYKSYQSGLNRYVAVKVLTPIHAKQPGFGERFRREAEAIANLHHPNILPVYDSGQEEGYSFIVMRHIEGARTLKEVMKNPLSLEQVADLVGQIAAALDHAHQRGVIHRDVKPGNVLMDGDWALLTDFGLAKITESSVKLTGSGVGVGTPAYMSPEQGKGMEVDYRTDVYSLGIILFEMLTGQIPHDAETPFAIVLKRMTEPLPLPRSINPEISESVERVLLKALAREPGDRFGSAGEMAAALKQAVSESAVVEQPSHISSGMPTSVPSQAEGSSAAAAFEPIPSPARSTFPWKWVAGIGAIAIVAVLLVVGLSSGLVRIGRPTPISTPTTTPIPVAAATLLVDTTPPLVVSTNPPNGATNVSRDLTSVSITFNEPMGDGVDLSAWGLPESAETQVDYDPETFTFTFTWVWDIPEPLQPNTTVTLDLNLSEGPGFDDAAGNQAPAYTFSFTTTDVPEPMTTGTLIPVPTPTLFPELAFSVQVVGYGEHGAMLEFFYDGEWSDLDGLAMQVRTSQNGRPKETRAVEIMEGRYLAEMTDVMYRFGEFDVELVFQEESNPVWSNTVEMRAEFEQWYPFIHPIFAASDFTDRSLDIVETHVREGAPEYKWYAKDFCSPCDGDAQSPGTGTPVYMPFSFQVTAIREGRIWAFHPYTGFIFWFDHVTPGPLIEDFLSNQDGNPLAPRNEYEDPYPYESDIIPYDPSAIMCTWAPSDNPYFSPFFHLEGQISYPLLGLQHPDITPWAGHIDGGGVGVAWGNPRYNNCAALGLGDYGPCFTPDGEIAVANISMERFLLNGWVDPGK